MVDDLLRLILAHLERTRNYPIVVSGGVGAGKTESCRAVARELEGEYHPGGVLSPRLMESGVTTGYDALDLDSGEKRPFVRSDPPGEKVGRFFLRPDGLNFATSAIVGAIGRNDPVFVDEIGRMELKGKGLARASEQLMDSESQGIYLVRSQFLSKFREAFDVFQYDEYRVTSDND